MSSHQKDWLDVLESVSPAHADRRETDGQPPWSVRVWARLFASRFDEEIEAGVAPVDGSPLATHWMRLTSVRERHDLAFTSSSLDVLPSASFWGNDLNQSANERKGPSIEGWGW